jgi:pimeloyl-ACP methyl ester carboxylesterase
MTNLVNHQEKLSILLLPGFMLDARVWDDIKEGLSELGSLSFGDITQDDSLEAMAKRVLLNAPPRFVLVGFSMGGYVAQWIYKFAPERVIALILMNTSAHQQSEFDVAKTQAQIELAKQYPFKGLTKRALTSSVDPDRTGDQALLDRLQTMAIHNGKDVFIRQLSAMRNDGYEDLQKVQCPTLIIASRNDQMRSVDEALLMANRIPQSKMVVMEHCGHMTPLEKPVELLEVLTNWFKESDFEAQR